MVDAVTRALIEALKDNNRVVVKSLIGRCSDANACDEDGKSLLMYAAMTGDSELVQLLIDKGADVNHKDKYGRSALIEAITGNHFELCQLLIDNKAKVNSRNRKKPIPLHAAADLGNLQIIHLLMKSGANVKAKDMNGVTASQIALIRGHEDACKLISQPETQTELIGKLNRGEEVISAHSRRWFQSHKAIMNRLYWIHQDSVVLHGRCFGLEITAMQSYLNGTFNMFEQIMTNMLRIPEPVFNRVANELIRKNFDSFEDKENALAHFNELYLNEIFGRDLEMSELIDMEALADTVNLYHNSNERYYKHLIEFDDRPKRQREIGSAIKILMPKVSTGTQQELSELISFGGIYTRQELKAALDDFVRCLGDNNIQQRISLSLGGLGHAINVSFDPVTHEWFFYDANQLPAKIINNTIELISYMEKSEGFQTKNQKIPFEAQVYCLHGSDDNSKFLEIQNALTDD